MSVVEDVREGFARCVTSGCEMVGEDRPIEFRVEVTSERAEKLPITITSTEHLVPVDVEALVCPSCGGACAVLNAPPRTVPKSPLSRA